MTNTRTLDQELLNRMDAYSWAVNYLSVGQISMTTAAEALVGAERCETPRGGHWATTPGQNFIYLHLDRATKKYDRTPAAATTPPASNRTRDDHRPAPPFTSSRQTRHEH